MPGVEPCKTVGCGRVGIEVYVPTSAQVYEATAWPAFRSASKPVEMPLQSSTRWMGLPGMWYLGRDARGWGM